MTKTIRPRRPAPLRAALATLPAVALALLPALPGTAAAQEEDEPLPLEAARYASIDLTEGTWISVDVSPDGGTLVFDYLGDLYTVPITGGDATQLTSGMAVDAQPRFSPDGEWVAFSSDRSGGQNIWIVRLDGSDTVQISRGDANRAESPEWTADGDYIVASMGDFRASDLPKLHLYHVEGGSGTKLIDEPTRLKTLGAAFGDDDRWIWFARRTGDWEYNAQLPQYQLAVYDRDTGETYPRSSRWGSAFRPTLSPDGRWLVYGTRWENRTGLILRELESGDERWLAYPVQHDDQESRATLDVLPGMSFTPDSESLVASFGGKIWRIPVAEGAPATEIPFRVRADVAIGPEVDFDYPVEDTPTFTVRQIRDAVPSPDGERLAFTAMDRLWVSAADGSNPRRLTDSGASEHFPSWSPDGRWIAYATWEDGVGAIHKVRSDGSGDPARLTQRNAVWLDPTWSPDGERIVAARGAARAYRESSSPFAALGAGDELVWVPAEGGRAELIMPTDGRSAPHFVPARPDRIYLYRGSDETLVSVRWDGTDEKEHVRVRGATPAGYDDPLDPDVILMAPEGDQALAMIQHHLYTVTVPRVGEVPTISVASPESAPFPARQLTRIGAEFPAWGSDGRTVHWSLGNAHFVYDLDAADAFADSVEAAEEAEAARQEEEVDEEAGEEDADDDGDAPRYEPVEVRVVIEAGRDIPRGTAVLRGARIVTMRGDEVIEEGDVVVVDNRIAAVGATGAVEVPDGAEVIDVAGHTVVPGFVDTHAHMWPQWGLHRPDQWIYLANLAYGVTTTRDPQTSRTDVLSYADLVRAGEITGPRVYSTGPGVFWQDMVGSLEEARDRLRAYAEYFDTKTIKMYVAGNRQQRQWIIMAARELGLMPTTEGSLNLRQNIAETIDGYPGLEHSLPVYPVYDDVLELFVASGRVYTPTLLVAYGGPWAENFFFQTEDVWGDEKLQRFTPTEELMSMTRRRGQWFMEEEHVFDDHARFVADLVAAGGKAGVGSHGQLQGLGYHWELWAMAAGGMPPMDALRVATLHGAEAIGLDRDLGTVEPGKLADLVILRENPLEDLRNTNTVAFVMKNGRLYDADSMAEVFPRQREIEPLWWWDAAPDPSELPGVEGGGM